VTARKLSTERGRGRTSRRIERRSRERGRSSGGLGGALGAAGASQTSNGGGLSFVEQWADPNDAVWSEPVMSACAPGSTNPDRVIFTGVNWTFTTEAQWETQLTAAVATFKMKYPAVREIDLMTMLRAPNNQVCGQADVAETNEQVVQAFIGGLENSDARARATQFLRPELRRIPNQ
jgi:hypothetical protein